MSMKRVTTILAILLLIPIAFGVRAEKKELNHDVYDSWQRVAGTDVSNDGRYVVSIVSEQEGDSYLMVTDLKKNRELTIERGRSGRLTHDSKYLLVRVKPSYAESREAKIAKTKPEKMPKDSLFVVRLADFNTVKIANVARFDSAKEGSDFFVYTLDDSLATKGGQAKASQMLIYNLKNGAQDTVKNVTSSAFNESGTKLLVNIAKEAKDSLSSNQVVLYTLPSLEKKVLSEGRTIYSTLSISKSGDNVAFLATTDSLKQEIKSYTLMHYSATEKADSARVIFSNNTKGVPEGWGLSQHSELKFSDSESRLIFGTAPIPQPKDTLTPAFEKASLDIWHWSAPEIPTEEKSNLARKRKETFAAIYDLKSGEYRQLGSKQIPSVTFSKDSDSDYAIGIANERYQLASHWDYMARLTVDVWLFDLKNNNKKMIKEGHTSYLRTSPSLTYLAWYEPYERAYYAYEIATGKEYCISEGAEVNFWNEERDTPAIPGPYGFGQWIEGEESMLAYDAYDVWKLDLRGVNKPVNYTKGVGRENNVVLRPIKLDRDEDYLPSELLLSAFDKISKDAGYYLVTEKRVEKLVMAPYKFSMPKKAKDKELYVYSKSNFVTTPDVYATADRFKKERQLTHINPQMADYLWGTAELVKWEAFDGTEVEGILYKPENFDPNKKYPMMVYFYERMSDEIHQYYPPAPSRSIINIPFYASRGYIVFVPDIHYVDGHPGESSYNCIVSGVEELMKEPWVDSDNIGMQGQSWGGYQTAYLVTRTNIFKAAGSGAPVSNMFSAYGGIRWESGISRQYQYEQGQSRIGSTMWESPELYVENSPIFFLPKVETPLLIMHNDNDGAVPWYQGIELFMGMRRLGKPAWLLQYNNEAHNLRERRNTMDLVVRWQQFFDHYLKGEPMPKWMKEGVPTIDKGEEYGLELEW